MNNPGNGRWTRLVLLWTAGRCNRPPPAALEHGITLEVVKLPEARRGFVRLPRRGVIERSFGRAARSRRLARDYERRPETLAGLHDPAFAGLMQPHQTDGMNIVQDIL